MNLPFGRFSRSAHISDSAHLIGVRFFLLTVGEIPVTSQRLLTFEKPQGPATALSKTFFLLASGEQAVFFFGGFAPSPPCLGNDYSYCNHFLGRGLPRDKTHRLRSVTKGLLQNAPCCVLQPQKVSSLLSSLWYFSGAPKILTYAR